MPELMLNEAREAVLIQHGMEYRGRESVDYSDLLDRAEQAEEKSVVARLKAIPTHPYKEVMIHSGRLEVPVELYQRRLDETRAHRIAENFDPRLLNDPKVSYRDNRYFVFDGQHTLAGLRILNNNQELSVRVRLYTGMTAKEEAELFAKQFGDSESVSAGVKLRAMVFAENPEAVTFVDTVNKAGFDVDYGHRRGNNRIGCISAALREFRRMDRDCFNEVLALIRDAWDGAAEALRSEVFVPA